MRVRQRGLAFIFVLVFSPLVFASGVEMIAAKPYNQQRLSGWLASERLDGARAFWDGKTLWTETGRAYSVPAHFLKQLPDFALDGVLYMGRGHYKELMSKLKSNKDWSGIRYHVFDVPDRTGELLVRLYYFENWLVEHPSPDVMVIPQLRIGGIEQAQALLQRVLKKGGDALILRDPQPLYETGPSDSMLELKNYQQATCKVKLNLYGNREQSERLSEIVCEAPDQRLIRIQSGFSEKYRRSPAPIGSTIIYRYNGMTDDGKPRFARFWRERISI